MKKILGLLLVGVLTNTALSAQQLDHAAVSQMVENRKFVFVPQTMSGSGNSRPIALDFDLRIMNDSLVSYLPFVGRGYGPVAPGQGGISFTSTDFEYKAVSTSKGWEVSIRPKDYREVRQMSLTVFENGHATLFVNSINRQPISYQGYLKKLN